MLTEKIFYHITDDKEKDYMTVCLLVTLTGVYRGVAIAHPWERKNMSCDPMDGETVAQERAEKAKDGHYNDLFSKTIMGGLYWRLQSGSGEAAATVDSYVGFADFRRMINSRPILTDFEEEAVEQVQLFKGIQQ